MADQPDHLFCTECDVCLDQHPLYFMCDERDGQFCEECRHNGGPYPLHSRCLDEHGEGCETVVFNSPMDAPKTVGKAR